MTVNFDTGIDTGIFVLLTRVLTGAVGSTSGRREGCWDHLGMGKHATLAERMGEGGEEGKGVKGWHGAG